MERHCCAATPVPRDRSVTSQSGTNGYVSTWGALCAGCQPPVAFA